MKLWLWSELKEKIEADLDLQEEVMITDSELLGYCNEAIDEAEAEILNMYQNYFKTSAYVSLVDGTSSYSLPSDIYAAKILFIQHDDGTDHYKIERINDIEKADVEDDDDYMFDIENPTAGEGQKLILYPAAKTTSSTIVKLWYIRNANRLTGDTSVLDIPESANFIIQYCKVKCMEKEVHPLLQKAMADLEKQRELLKQTLDQMIPDENETIEPDVSFYNDFEGI